MHKIARTTSSMTTTSTGNSATIMPQADQSNELMAGHDEIQKLDYASTESNSNMAKAEITQSQIDAGTVAAGSEHNADNGMSPGISLLQSSPPPASYRHSRAYRHFKNPPQPHMCIRTTTEVGEELFINVLSWTRIVIPQEPSDPIPLYGGMRVPPGSPRSPPIVFAVMANPEVLKDSGRHSKDAEERRAMVELMCDFVEAMNPGVKLIRNAIILKDRDISGELKDVWNAVQAQRDREREEQLIQQRQQQQYVTTQQMFPKTAVPTATVTASASSLDAGLTEAIGSDATSIEINMNNNNNTSTTSTTMANTMLPIMITTTATSSLSSAAASVSTTTATTRIITSNVINLPTPTPVLIGGRCGSLVGSGCNVASTKTTISKAYEENANTAASSETSIGEKSERINIVPKAFATSANSVAPANTATTTPASGIIITTAAACIAATTTTTSTTTPQSTNITNVMTTHHDKSHNVMELMRIDQQATTGKATTSSSSSSSSSLSQFSSQDMEANCNENGESIKNDDKSNNNKFDNFLGNDYVDANKKIEYNYIGSDATSFCEINNQHYNDKYQLKQQQQQNTANHHYNDKLEYQQQQQKHQQNQFDNDSINTKLTTNAADELINAKIKATTDKTTDTQTAIKNNIITKSATSINEISCVKTTNSLASESLSTTTTTTTSSSKLNNNVVQKLGKSTTTTTAASTTTNTTTTTTMCMPTKREKLGGFLPNGCIFPRFKNSKNKDKDREKDKEPKTKDKEKTLLNALKKNKDKKINAQDKKSTANNNINNNNNNKSEKVTTTTSSQLQQPQNMPFSEQTPSKTQYEKNCINLENEMQKLDINKIDAANNSEKNMFIKLKCAASSAVAK